MIIKKTIYLDYSDRYQWQPLLPKEFKNVHVVDGYITTIVKTKFFGLFKKVLHAYVILTYYATIYGYEYGIKAAVNVPTKT